MDRQILLNQFIQQELNRYKSHYKTLNALYPQLPAGSITKVTEGQYSRVLRENGKQVKIALGPHDNDLLEDLMLHRQLKAALPLLKKKINIMDNLLAKDFIYDPLQLSLPEQYLEINPKLFLPGDCAPADWANASYKKGRFYAKDIKHYTESGVVTRSKAEAMIGTQLERSGLLFRYEQALKICGETIYPDFVIMHPITRRLIYWEHLGKLDDPKYVRKNLRRLMNYGRSGIYLGLNLVITYETLDAPLTIKTIDEQIQEIINMH